MIKDEKKIGYSLALLEIAKEEKKIKEFYAQATFLEEVLNDENNRELEKVLDSFLVGIDEKNKIIDEIFKKEIHWSILNSIKLLSSKNQFRYFKDILKILIKNLEDILKIKRGIVYSVKPLKATEIKKMETKISDKLGYDVSLKNLIDKELIAGFKIKVGNEVIEDSVKLELELMKKTLKIKKGGVI